MIGQRVSRYRILARLGAGGMGEVYLAEDPSLNRRVALKFISRLGSDDQEPRRRLLHEAHAAARLDHPYVCRIYEVSEAADQPFIAMEYVEGPALKDRLASGPFALRDSLRLASEIAEALDAGHRRGILHRDLKPANVMIAADGHVRVLDFGVAKWLADPGGEGDSTLTALTRAGAISGTLSYMSPEQLRGEVLDARSDVFAFGVLLYEMLAAVHPFAAAAPIDTAERILNQPERPIDERLPSIPPVLAHVVKRCLEKDRQRRYQTLGDVHLELRALLDGSSPAAPVRRIRGGHWRLTAAAAVAVLAVAGVSTALWRWPELFPWSEPALAFAERDWVVLADVENLTQDAVFDRTIRLALGVAIAQSQYVNVFPDDRLQPVLRRMQRPPGTMLDEATAVDLAVREGIRAVVTCSIAEVGGKYLLAARVVDPSTRLGVINESEPAEGKDRVLAALDALAKRIRQRLGESLDGVTRQGVYLPLATTGSLEALKLFADAGRSKPEVGQELLRQALVLDPDFAMAHAELGRAYYFSDRREVRLQGEQHLTRAVQLSARLTTREQLWIAATADDSRGLRAQAAQGYENYLAQYPDDARAWFRLGWTRMAGLSEYGAAIAAFERTIALVPRDASAHVNLASSLSGSGRFSAAVDMYRKAFALDPALIEGWFVNHEYGIALIKAGDIEAAADVYRKTIAAQDVAKQARGRRSLALLEMYRGRYDVAVSELRQAVLINQRVEAPTSEFRDRMFLAQALWAKRTTRAAGFVELSAAYALTRRLTLGPDWLHRLAQSYARHGRIAEARQLLTAMEKTAFNAATDSTTNRNTALDRTHMDVARAEIALAEGNTNEALHLLEPIVAADPDGVALEPLARAYAAAHRPADAIARYEAFLARRPLGLEAQTDWLATHVRLGDLYEASGRPEDARKVFERLADIWKGADRDLDLLIELEKRLAR